VVGVGLCLIAIAGVGVAIVIALALLVPQLLMVGRADQVAAQPQPAAPRRKHPP